MLYNVAGAYYVLWDTSLVTEDQKVEYAPTYLVVSRFPMLRFLPLFSHSKSRVQGGLLKPNRRLEVSSPSSKLKMRSTLDGSAENTLVSKMVDEGKTQR